MTKFLTALTALCLLAFAFAATAVAAGAVTPEDGSLLDLARPIFDAVMHGQWWLGAALAVVFVTAATRRYLPDAYGGKFARGDVGGLITAFLIAFGGALATTFAAPGAVMSGAVLLVGLKVGLGAVGGFVALNQLAKALAGTEWFKTKAPAWLRTGLTFLLALIGSSAIAKAEKAGDAAVAANPATGGAGPSPHTDV